MRSGLSAQVLGRIWGLSDYDKDGQLTKNEFNVAMKVTSCIWLSHYHNLKKLYTVKNPI